MVQYRWCSTVLTLLFFLPCVAPQNNEDDDGDGDSNDEGGEGEGGEEDLEMGGDPFAQFLDSSLVGDLSFLLPPMPQPMQQPSQRHQVQS